MRVTVRATEVTLDVDVTIVDPEVPVGEVFFAITGQPAGSTIFVDDWPYRAGDVIGSIPIHNGSLMATEPTGAVDHDARLIKVAGDGAGHVGQLRTGAYDIGPGRAGRVEDPLFRLDLRDGPDPTVYRLGPEPVTVDGESIPIGDGRRGRLIRAGDTTFRVDEPATDRPPVLPLSDNGRVPYQRRPHQLATESTDPPAKPGPPKPAQQAQPFSWIVAVVPIPVGLLAAFFFRSPFFLIFILMSPVLAGGRWLESRHRTKKDKRRFAAESAEAVATYGAAMTAWQRSEAAVRRRNSPDLGRLADRARRLEPGLWERRPDHPDFLQAVVGLGEQTVPLDPSDFAAADAVGAATGRLRSVPIAVDLGAESGVGIVGDRARCRELVAAMVTELCVNHGPGDLSIGLLLEPDVHGEWDWAKWLPHLEDDRGFRYVATDLTAASIFLTSLPRPDDTARWSGSAGDKVVPPTPVPLVVVDGERFLDGAFTTLSVAVRSNAARAIVIADDPDQLPAICSTVVTLGSPTAGATATVTSMRTGAVDDELIPVLLDRDVAASVNRNLAGLRDPDRVDEGSDLPQECDLRSLVDGDLGVESTLRRWAVPSRRLDGTVGVAQHGLLRLDLVDDGPHALVAGTTGSGKSELLRTIVAALAYEHSPVALNFVLIDFKGGGAFDACGDLPHTVGVVTDLDEHLAARALRCLKAELRFREHKLRAAEVSDLRDYDVADDPLARLVVVVDEFATLAAELPDFMASLVDIAQRGRSLGIHMILATQRPTGVVDAKIRANTNLRISLRVQDDGDSQDVIGDARAAKLDRRSPGRGYVRLGASELNQFQTAIVSRPSVDSTNLPLRVTTFELGAPIGDDTGERAELASLGETDLEALARSANEATARLALDPPRVPWPAPLPPLVEALDLADPALSPPWSAPLGIADLPDEQRTEVYWWTPELGNLIVYGADSSSTSQALATLAIGLARRHRADDAHLYLIDFSGGGGLSGLADLPNIGAVVNPADEERLVRVLDLLDQELARRSELARSAGQAKLGPASGLPLIVLGIANYGAMIGYFEETNQFEMGGRFERLIRDGTSLGLFVVATANHERGVPTRVASQVESKLIMRMADPNSYTAFGLRTRDVPDLGPARAIDVRTGLEVQVASYAEGAAAVTSGLDRAGRNGGGPRQVSVLEHDLAPGPIVTQSSAVRNGWGLVVGLQHSDLGPARLDLRPGTNLVVAGGSGSGKTTALRSLVLAARHADPGCQIVVLSHDDEWPARTVGFTVDRVAADRRTLIVVDGLSLIDDELARDLEGLDPATNWLAVADRPESLASPPLWFRRIPASRTGLMLQPQPDHGDVFRTRLPMRAAKAFPAGRGYAINAGVLELVQVANATEADVDALGLEPLPPPAPPSPVPPPSPSPSDAGVPAPVPEPASPR